MKFLPTLLVASLLVGCSSIANITDVTDLVNYSNHKSIKVLEIPPDLDAPSFDKTYVTSISDSMDATKSARLDQVPLVDESIGVLAADAVKVVQKGTQNIMQIEGTPPSIWKGLNEAIKGMGMTITKSDQAEGLIVARDRSTISDPSSPIGRFLNKSLGRLNQGEQYQFRVSGSDQQAVVEVADKAGKVLPAGNAKLILDRLRKEYTSK